MWKFPIQNNGWRFRYSQIINTFDCRHEKKPSSLVNPIHLGNLPFNVELSTATASYTREAAGDGQAFLQFKWQQETHFQSKASKNSGNKEWTGTPRRELYFMQFKNNKLIAYGGLPLFWPFQAPRITKHDDLLHTFGNFTAMNGSGPPCSHVGQGNLGVFLRGKTLHLSNLPRERTQDLEGS